jgi:hypothetical protein
MLQRANRRDLFEVVDIMDQGQYSLQRDLGDATIDDATNGDPCATKLEVYRGSLPPAAITEAYEVLYIEKGNEARPLDFITCTLQQLDLCKP